jgi:hypothetical protein
VEFHRLDVVYRLQGSGPGAESGNDAGLCGLFLVTALPLGAGQRLAMSVSPAVSFAPGNLVVRTMVEADAGNRAIEVVAESQDFYRSSEVALDGDRAARTTTFEFRSLPCGKYAVKATLTGSGGEPLGIVRQEVNVIANGAGQ